METLEIESTERTPGIKFDYDHHYFEINGEAYPENSDEFFRPIMESLQEYSGLGSSETITFVFRLIYFNSSSARVLMNLFELLDEMAEERNVEKGVTKTMQVRKKSRKIFSNKLLLRMKNSLFIYRI